MLATYITLGFPYHMSSGFTPNLALGYIDWMIGMLLRSAIPATGLRWGFNLSVVRLHVHC